MLYHIYVLARGCIIQLCKIHTKSYRCAGYRLYRTVGMLQLCQQQAVPFSCDRYLLYNMAVSYSCVRYRLFDTVEPDSLTSELDFNRGIWAAARDGEEERVRELLRKVMWPRSHCTLHTAHYTLHTAHCTLHNAHCLLHTTHCIFKHRPSTKTILQS